MVSLHILQRTSSEIGHTFWSRYSPYFRAGKNSKPKFTIFELDHFLKFFRAILSKHICVTSDLEVAFFPSHMGPGAEKEF